MEPIESKRLGMARSNKPADEMAPVVRQIAADDFEARPNSERIAREYGSGRLHVVDAVVYEALRRIHRMEVRLGVQRKPMASARDGFGRPQVTAKRGAA